MSGESKSEFDIFDILVKIIPGGVFLIFVIFIIPPVSVFTDIFSTGGFGLVIAALPLAYITGTIIQGLSGACFPRQRNFQRTMKQARENTSFDKENMTISGGDPVSRFVLADAIFYFKLDEKYIEPSSSEYNLRKYPTPIIYTVICYPLLRFAVAFSRLDKSDLNRTRRYYGGEREIFRLVEQYVDDNDIGKIERFRSIYVLHRSMVIAVCILVPLLIVSAIAALSTSYQPFVGWKFIFILAVSSFISIPVFYKGMIRYEGIRDRRMMYAYYNSRIRDSPLSDEYAICKES